LETDPGLLNAGAEGFILGASLIVAIGAQNAFVLRQGLARRHVFAVAALCAFSDSLLIAAGVAGLGRIIRLAPAVMAGITIAGAAFLAGYGLLSLCRALRPEALHPARGSGEAGFWAAIATALALTFLNPHVYLDTLVLIGGLSARYAGSVAGAFGVGAVLASVAWFFGLAYGARLLAPLFARPRAWQLLDVLIAGTMWAIAGRLIAEVL
jgi:L-lysine exporter family protein LysE/ArgO